MKKYWKSVNIYRSYGQLSNGSFFYERRCIIRSTAKSAHVTSSSAADREIVKLLTDRQRPFCHNEATSPSLNFDIWKLTNKVIDIVLRNSGTSFNLLHCSYKLYKQSFVNSCLFRDCYWQVLPCGTYILFDLIWFVIIFSTIIGWRLTVLTNDMLCYVMLCAWQLTPLQWRKHMLPASRCDWLRQL